jgi:hypothetical protein
MLYLKVLMLISSVKVCLGQQPRERERERERGRLTLKKWKDKKTKKHNNTFNTLNATSVNFPGKYHIMSGSEKPIASDRC